ncbi:MAG: four helix bundle protein [Anaerolineae bacterium]|jgi:four helix bundle protein
MALKFEELRVLQAAEGVADGIWRQVVQWDPFARNVVGEQLARAADSVGANIAEAFGRFHYGEKLQFLYYARGSLFETKYWLNRALARALMPSAQVQDYASQSTDLARQLNAFAATLRAQRQGSRPEPKKVREATPEYSTVQPGGPPIPLFTEDELQWVQTINT